MSIIETNEDAILLRHHHSQCCQQKQYYINHKATLVNTLEILPRVIVYKKSVKVGNTYETLVTVTNNGLHNRRLIYTTDSDDITINVYPKYYLDNFLESDKSLQITVCLDPKAKFNINRRRHVFIQAEHPNVTFALPIILAKAEDTLLSVPETIAFPSTCVGTFTFYEMILYNMNNKKLSFTLKCNYAKLTIMLPAPSIPKRGYIKILLKLYCKDVNEVRDVIKLKCGMDVYEIPFVHQPIEWTLFLDNLYMQFDPIKFNRTTAKSFRICNESQHSIKFHLTFSREEENITFDESHKSSPDRHSSAVQTPMSPMSHLKPATSRTSESYLHNDQTITENRFVDKFPTIHFQFEPKCGTMPANSSSLINITFKPVMHKDFNPLESPPFRIITSLVLRAEDDRKCELRVILIKGYINGTDIDIIPKMIDFRNVYFGEENCTQIKVINIDGITDCHVDFHDIISQDDVNVVVTPKEGFDLKPCQSVLFHLQFFAKVVGKFMVKLQFKVRNGCLFSAIVRGFSQHVRVKCFPDVLDLGIVPVCVPQKRLVLLMNPLPVPITVQCSVPEDGSETPLVLNVTDTDEHLPIHVKDPVYYMNECQQNEDRDVQNLKDGEVDDEKNLEFEHIEPSLLSYHSVTLDDNSSQHSYSTDFQEQALDLIPGMTNNLLSFLKKIKIFDKPEMEKKVVEEALNSLLQTPYFYDMDKYKNYCNMDWNALSSDPKEIYCNHEIIYLHPNTGKAISIVVIPNVIGRQNKFLELRVCPVLPPPSDEADPSLRQIVDSKHLLSKLWIEYNCSIPEIIWDNVIDMQDPLYAGELYEFEMIFENCSKIGGFFYYEAIPDNDFGTMRFLNDRWKYFVEPESTETVACAVEFKKTGFVTLLGLIKFVGVTTGFPFHIKSQILPPRVNIVPQQIVHKLTVLEMVDLYVYIDNATPTTTWLSLKLKDDSHVSVYPEGAQLAPTGQGTYGILKVFYKDPGTYKNVLYITMQYETIKKIPITLHVEGMPISFDPDIQTEGLHIGSVLCNAKDECGDDKPIYSKAIRIINNGERQYRMAVTKTKCSAKPSCTITPFKAKINVKPCSLAIEPMSVDYLLVSTNASEECSLYNEFRVDVIDTREPTRKQTFRFVVTAQFIFPQLVWNRREITMNYHRTHRYKEQTQWEILKLTNPTDNFMHMVVLKTTGPFLLKEYFEDQFVKELVFPINGLETKQIFIMLDMAAIRNRVDTSFIEGRITCLANAQVQKSVYLKVNVFTPTLIIKQNEVVLFTKNMEGGTYVHLYNPGPVQTIYQWKKLQEEWRCISEEDDSQEVVDVILSDIIRSLHVETIIFEDDSEPNMTKRYQKLRCFLHELDDPVEIRSLIYDIVDDLDFTTKRYKLDWLEAPPPPAEPRKTVLEELLENEKCFNGKDEDLEIQIDKTFQMQALQQQTQLCEHISQLEDQLNSKTLFFNRKFLEDPSSFDTENQTSSETTCVYHTLDHVVAHLKLDDSYSISQPSSDACDPQRSLFFIEKSGVLQENQTEMCALHLPPIRRGYEVRAAFHLNVVGGKSQEFCITLVNLHKTLKLDKDSVYLGVKPWYENFKTKVTAENITNYRISLNLCAVLKPSDKLPKIANGYVKMLNEKSLVLPALQSVFLKTEGIMGFSEEFMREIRITINDGEATSIRLRGHGVMPMLALSRHNLPPVEQDIFEIMEEYCMLQKIYYMEIFKTITERDEDTSVPQTEENEAKKALSLIMDLTMSSSETNSMGESTRPTARHEQEIRFFRVLQTYVWVNNNEALPNSRVLHQLVETEKFRTHLCVNTEACSLLTMVYQEYLRLRHMCEGKANINLKHFTTQSLPFQMRGHILDMDQLPFNQYRKFVVTLEFVGPGKLIAAARTSNHIPGLLVDFEVVENIGDKDFVYYRYENKQPDLYAQPYRNMNERQQDAGEDPRVKHAHSYDLSRRSHSHQRDAASGKERKWLMNYYNSLNKSVYLEQKHHITHCKIFSNCKYNFSGTKVNVIVLIRPEKEYYKHSQEIEDYLYIDLHMGPTLPILLRGTIVDRDDDRNTKS